MYDTHFSTFASGQDASFQGTLSHNAFDELKQQHLQYQQTFQQHQVKGHQQRYDEHRLATPDDDDLSPTTIFTSDAGIPLEDVAYMEKTSKMGLIQHPKQWNIVLP